MPAISEPVRVSVSGSGDLRLVASNPSKLGETDVFDFRLKTPDEAELGLPHTPIPPMRLVRVEPGSGIDPYWRRASSASSATDDALTDAEMSRIFEADQAARQDVAAIDWKVLAKADAERRARVGVMLERGELRSSADFLHASFIFQHGETPADYLLAHTLALVAMKKGDAKASWMAAASLDRYLQTVGQPQVFGTQFKTSNSGPVSQEPYDRALISDALRRLLGVPDQKGQEAQMAGFEAAAKPK
jgi:hypothetical protein